MAGVVEQADADIECKIDNCSEPAYGEIRGTEMSLTQLTPTVVLSNCILYFSSNPHPTCTSSPLSTWVGSVLRRQRRHSLLLVRTITAPLQQQNRPELLTLHSQPTLNAEQPRLRSEGREDGESKGRYITAHHQSLSQSQFSRPSLPPKRTPNTDLLQPCCVCKDEKSRRDECMLFSRSDDPQEDCKSMVAQYKDCMAGYGFKI